MIPIWAQRSLVMGRIVAGCRHMRNRRRAFGIQAQGRRLFSLVHASGVEAAYMRKRNRKAPGRKIVLRLPDLDQTKSAVLNSLSSPCSRRNYKIAMEQFIAWYCSEPRLALNRAVVLRFRLHLESVGLAAGTINQRLGAVRRLAYEAADSGLLSPELAAGIRRVKGVKQLGARTGNWLTRDQARLLLEKADGDDLRCLRDFAMISILLGCGLRRAELSALTVEDMQIRQGHWAIVDLVGKGGHIRTVPMPNWVKFALDRWMTEAKVNAGRIFRAVSRQVPHLAHKVLMTQRLLRSVTQGKRTGLHERAFALRSPADRKQVHYR